MKQMDFFLQGNELLLDRGLLTCEYCDTEYSADEVDQTDEGFWCDACGSDGVEYFTYFEPNKRPQFLLFLESKAQVNDPYDRQAAFKLNKRLSPFRYPGGKSKIAQHLAAAMRPQQLDTLVSVYAGGASVELAMLQAGLVKQLIMNDIDFGIFSLFYLIKEHPDDLIQRIRTQLPSHDDFFRYRDLIKTDYAGADLLDAAWAALIVNRLAYSGIYSANPLGGRSGSQKRLLARYNPDDLCQRILQIHAMSHRMTLSHQNALPFIEEQAWHPNSTLFLDPPYYEKGSALYRHFYTEQDHRDVSWLLQTFYEQMPGADIVITYDDHPFIRELYYHATEIELKRSFSA
ncbi:DNA adenine methylase [Paenibacillus shenyangensis]|uniref:DNA adenine methylase n=1 Tax=Paenibacillus sp. A9 TaxID=1284352 RepID=UPI000687C206|nr:DNA adenine methylase [Paenibacillus sp. A9]